MPQLSLLRISIVQRLRDEQVRRTRRVAAHRHVLNQRACVGEIAAELELEVSSIRRFDYDQSHFTHALSPALSPPHTAAVQQPATVDTGHGRRSIGPSHGHNTAANPPYIAAPIMNPKKNFTSAPAS